MSKTKAKLAEDLRVMTEHACEWERLYRKARGELHHAEAKLESLGNVEQHLKSCENACAEWQEKAEAESVSHGILTEANYRLQRDLDAALRIVQIFAKDSGEE